MFLEIIESSALSKNAEVGLNSRKSFQEIVPHSTKINENQSPDVTQAVAQRCFVKKVFLEISQYSQEDNCARVSFLIKLQVSGLQLY